MKKKLQREGIFKEMKQRRAYEKPSEKRHVKSMNLQEDLRNYYENELKFKVTK